MWTYLPASVCSADTADSILPSDSPASNPAPSATSSGTSTVSKSCASVKSMDSWMTRRSSGETSENSMDSPGVEEWISSLPAHPANLIVKPENCAEPATIETSSPIRSESLAKYSREESIWKMSQVCLFDQKMDGQPTLEPWSESWPRSGMTVDGTLYPRKTLAHRINEPGSGLWPTPDAFNDPKSGGSSPHQPSWANSKQQIHLHHAVKMWPTPRNADYKGAVHPSDTTARRVHTGEANLPEAVQESVRLWPTPVADGDRTTNYKQGGTSLGYAARSPMLPTPSATKNTPNTVDVADLVDSDGNPWELGRKPYDRRTGQPVSTTLADVVKTKGWSIPTPTPSDNWTGNLESSQQSDDSMHSVTLPGFVARFPTSTTEVRYNTPNTMDSMAPKSQKALDHEHDTARPGRTNPNNLRDLSLIHI